MRRLLLSVALALSAAACSSPPLVYSATDLADAPPSGSVRPLRELLSGTGTTLRLVFVHGVGDHCSGYALDPAKGWLNSEAAAAIGLRRLAGTTVAAHFVNVSVFMGGEPDERSRVGVATQGYAFNPPGSDRQVLIEAIEITWSPLTQWLKSNQLGYDSPSTTPLPGASSLECPASPDPQVPRTTTPPPRLLLDRIIKELVFDRNLSDAILYSGPYGAVMERGLAEGLCHAITGTPDDVKCAWPSKEQQSRGRYQYVFVTHSLGSRMTYDMFLDLLGDRGDAKPNPFTPAEQSASGDFIASMLADTPAIYMMANQLSLLGLANVPTNARSGSGAGPYASIAPAPGSTAPPGATDASRRPSTGMAFGDVITRLARVKTSAAALQRTDPSKLQIVAFNDTNDLLTWHVPSWYTNADIKAPDGRPLIDVVNVFVQNSPKLLVIESPGPAHQNYFRNSSVWEVIACGAANGAVRRCP